MASLGLQKLLGATGGGGSVTGEPQAQALDSRVRSSISLLVSSQSPMRPIYETDSDAFSSLIISFQMSIWGAIM